MFIPPNGSLKSPFLRLPLAALIVAFLIPATGCRTFLRDHVMKYYEVQADPYPGLEKPNKFQADFLCLKKLANEVVPEEDKCFPREKREAMEKQILESLGAPGCTRADFVLNIQAYLSGFNCQHAYIADDPRSADLESFYPFKVHYFSNELYLSNLGADKDESWIGKKIISINHYPVHEVEEKLFLSGNAESLFTKRAGLESEPSAYGRPELYRFAGLTSSSTNSVSIEFENQETLVLFPARKKSFKWKHEPSLPHPITGRVPHSYDIRCFPEQNFAYMQFNACFDKTAILDGLTMVRPWIRPVLRTWLNWEFHQDRPAEILDGIYDAQRPVLKDYLKKTIEDLHQQNITNLIIDLRRNAGGETETTRQLLYHLTTREDLRDANIYKYNPDVFKFYEPRDYQEFETWYVRKFGAQPPAGKLSPTEQRSFFHSETNSTSLYYVAGDRPVFNGRIILLVDQNTGSAAALFAATMKDNHLAEVVGTTTGNNPTGPTGMTPFKLPHSGIVLSLPTEYDVRAEPGDVFMPDYWVERSVDDSIDGRDAAFEKALELLNVRAPGAGPLQKAEAEAAINWLKKLKCDGGLPGWSRRDTGEATLESYSFFAPKTLTICVRKRGDSTRYRYTLAKTKLDADWHLQEAWRRNKRGLVITRYLISSEPAQTESKVREDQE